MRVLPHAFRPGSTLAYVLAAALAFLPALLIAPWHQYWGAANVAMLFLLAVALSAIALGRGPSVLCAALGIALFDLFFVEPRFSFSVSDARYLLTFAVMLTVALIISYLTSGLQRHALDATTRERQTRELYQLASQLTSVMVLPQLFDAVREFVHGNVDSKLVLLLPTADEDLHAVIDEAQLDTIDRLTATASYQHGAVMETHVLACGERGGIFVPLMGATRHRGVLGFVVPQGDFARLQSMMPTLLAAGNIVAAAIERLHFVEVASRAELAICSERLRSSILSALSHDIRTPLAALYGLADSLTLLSPPLPQQAQETLSALRAQTLQLNSLASNLLDMARLQAGNIALNKEWQPLEEIVGTSVHLLHAALSTHHVRVELPADLPLLAFDAVLMERVLCNLLENAAKYSVIDSDIIITAIARPGDIEVRVFNSGSGFPADKLQTVFDLFERGDAGSDIAGSGVGLAICRTIVEAHGGHIEARNPVEGGAVVAFTLPRGTPPIFEPELDSGTGFNGGAS